MRGEQAIFNLEIKKKSGSSINPDIHHSKVPSSGGITKIKRISIDPQIKSAHRGYWVQAIGIMSSQLSLIRSV